METAIRSWLSALSLVALLAAPFGVASADDAAHPQRVLSIGGSITETIYLLGEQDRLVAVDSTSLYPPEARELPDIGYMRTLSAEPILGLAPDLILADADAGPDPVIAQIEQSGIELIRFPKATDISGAVEKVRSAASALGRQADGTLLADRIAARATAVSDRARAMPEQPVVLFLLSIGRGAPLAAGTGTAAAGIIEAAGAVNAIAEFEGYKPLSPEAAVTANPDIILVPDRTLEALGGAEAILSRAEIAPTRAGKTGRLVAVDGLMVLGFGPRIAEAIETLATAFHPGIDLPKAE